MLEIILRPIVMSDALLIREWENDKSNWFVSDTHSEYTLDEIINLLDSLRDIEKAKQARYMIEDSSRKSSLGAIDLFNIDFLNSSACVGVLVANPENRNKGVAENALRLLEKICLDQLGIEVLYAKVFSLNTASIRLFEKRNFIKKDLLTASELINGQYIETQIFEKCLKN
ncbi:GNAT family N-acetyltransferase [Crocinitomicaceae bacterium]|nr:GNAT family N-acetyltransferase [Crocinitomicaceae bacterium]